MSLLFESIRYEGGWHHLEYHEARMTKAIQSVFKKRKTFNLRKDISLPKDLGPKKYICRIHYGLDIEDYHFQVYQEHTIKQIRFVVDENIKYPHKYTNRSFLNKHKEACAPFEEAIIINKGLIRDSTWSNVAFWNGTEWHTPTYPLLKGTCRARLLDKGEIISKKLRLEHLEQYSKVSFLSALNNLGECVVDINPYF